jgi:hypothetical protein
MSDDTFELRSVGDCMWLVYTVTSRGGLPVALMTQFDDKFYLFDGNDDLCDAGDDAKSLVREYVAKCRKSNP